MADKKTNLRGAILDLAKNIQDVFKKYSRQTREKAWEKISTKNGEKEIKKIIIDPKRQINTFGKLVTEKD